jgi:ribosome recycling factor
MLKQISEDTKRRMDKSMEVLQKELASIRTGRASLALLDHIGSTTTGCPLNQVAGAGSPRPAVGAADAGEDRQGHPLL